jgi:hypothetical protein
MSNEMVVTYTNCGDFRVYGMHGASEDRVASMWFACSTRDAPVTRLDMDPGTFRLLVDAFARVLGKPAETLGDGHDLLYRGARCTWSKDRASGTISFYVGDRLAGVMTGWTIPL